MAEHERPDDEKRPLITYICNHKHSSSAEHCIKLLNKFPLKVWETQYPKPKDYTCWYVGFIHDKIEQWILNFTIRSSFTIIEYRYPQYLPDKLLDNMKWQTSNWKYEKLIPETEDTVTSNIEIYLEAIKDDFENKKLKRGGKSFAEGFITNIIKDAFENQDIKRNIRPEWLRSPKGKYLELDIFLPKMNLAIEIQGLQHFMDIYSDKKQHEALKANDLLKKKRCKERNIKLVWMDWQGVNKCLMRSNREKRIQTIKKLLGDFVKSKKDFLLWKNMIDMVFE